LKHTNQRKTEHRESQAFLNRSGIMRSLHTLSTASVVIAAYE